MMTVDADSRDDAVQKMKTMMNEEAIAQHFAEKHQGEAVPSVDEVHTMIEQKLQEGDMSDTMPS